MMLVSVFRHLILKARNGIIFIIYTNIEKIFPIVGMNYTDTEAKTKGNCLEMLIFVLISLAQFLKPRDAN